MNRNLEKRVKAKIQDMVNKGELTFVGDNLVIHFPGWAFNVGNPDNDILSTWNLIKAYQNKFAS